MKNYIAFLPALLLLLYSCSGIRPAAAAPVASSAAPRATEPVILTLLLKASWNEDSSIHFEIFNDIRNKGSLKRSQAYNGQPDFVVYYLDAAGKRLDSSSMEHPLIDKAESGNDQGQLQHSVYKREEGYRNVRVNYSPSMKSIEIVAKTTGPSSQIINLKP